MIRLPVELYHLSEVSAYLLQMYQVVVISAVLLVVFWTTLATTCQTMADVHFRMPALTT